MELKCRDIFFLLIVTMNSLWSILPHLYMLFDYQPARTNRNTSYYVQMTSIGSKNINFILSKISIIILLILLFLQFTSPSQSLRD